MTTTPTSVLSAFNLKLFKSAGVPVTAAVHRLLVEANTARDRRDWPTAAAAYGRVLKRDPDLAHIWIQYGHALKELDDLDQAEAAYLKAAGLTPGSADAHLHLGHLKKLQGRSAEANRLYLTAAKLDPRNADALAELHRLVHHDAQIAPQDLLSILTPEAFGPGSDPDVSLALLARSERDLRSEVDIVASSERAADAGSPSMADQGFTSAPLVFDVSDLIAYFRDARLPTGIQRVQIEIITNALGRGPIHICCFIQEREGWLEIPPDIFVVLCRLSLASGDRTAPDWLTGLTRLHVVLSMTEVFAFPSHACLINLGTSWWIPNYFLSVRQAKATAGSQIRYVPFVHDFIPLLAAHCCATGLIQDFVGWAVGVFQHADMFLVNSEATKRDLLSVASLLNYSVNPDAVQVVRLDADFRKPHTSFRGGTLAARGLHRTPFVLFVSTIEARKNHVLALEAWAALVRSHGLKNVPKLVCVGKRGWLDDPVFAKLQAHEELRDRVVILSGLSDAELAELYRDCLFTLYPSTYEGWGLPVTESLCYGKTPLVSNGSSLPEAGGPFAVYFEAESVYHLIEALERLIYEPHYRRACEEKIRQQFQPRTWRELADQVIAAVAEVAPANPEGGDEARALTVELGAFHPLGRNTETRVWPGMRFAEAFRTGEGWWGQDDFGCWTKPQGGELEIGVASPHGTLRMHLQLRGTPLQATTFCIEVDGEVAVTGLLAADERKWVGVSIPPARTPRPRHRIYLGGESAMNLAECTGGGDPRIVSIGLEGFFVCSSDDAVARMAFLEAVTLDTLKDIAFSRPAGT